MNERKVEKASAFLCLAISHCFECPFERQRLLNDRAGEENL